MTVFPNIYILFYRFTYREKPDWSAVLITTDVGAQHL